MWPGPREKMQLLTRKKECKGGRCGNSLVVQWLGLRTLTGKGLGSIPGRGTKILHSTLCNQKKKKETDALTSPSFHPPVFLPRGKSLLTLQLGKGSLQRSFLPRAEQRRTRTASASKQTMDQQSIRKTRSDSCFNLFNKSVLVGLPWWCSG